MSIPRSMLSPLLIFATALVGTATVACTRNEPAAGGAPGAPGPSGSPDASAAPAPSLTASNLRIATTVGGLEMPTQIMFLGGEDMLVTLKKGPVVRVTGGKVAGQVLNLATNWADERGVLGITRHPQFDSNHFVYIYWTWNGQGGDPAGLVGAATDDLEKVPALGNRVDRFTWDGSKLNFDRNITKLPSKTTDLTLDRRRGNHDGGVLKFGPDGKLYVAIGDQNLRGQLQNIGDGDKLEDAEHLAGVLLRLNDDGTIPGEPLR